MTLRPPAPQHAPPSRFLDEPPRRADDVHETDPAAYARAFEHAPIGLLVFDRHGRIIDANRRVASLLERPATALRTTRIQDFVPPSGASVDTVPDWIDALFEGRIERHDAELSGVGPQQQRRLWLSMSASLAPSRDHGTAPGPLLGVAVLGELPERRRASADAEFLLRLDEALAHGTDAEQLVALACTLTGRHLGASQCQVAEIDDGGARITVRADWSLAGVSRAGSWPRSSYGAAPVRAELDAGRTVAVADVLTDSRTRHAADGYRGWNVRAFAAAPTLTDGQRRATLRVSSDQPRHWRADDLRLLRDVIGRVWPAVERARVQSALRQSEARFRTISDSDLLAIAFFRREGEITWANDAFLRMFQFSREALTAGEARWDVLTPPEWQERTAVALQTLQDTGRIPPYEREYFRADGTRFWGLSGGAMLPQGDEAVAFLLDVTSRKRVERALRRSDRLKDEFLAMLSHELRNPLAPIRNAVQLLQRLEGLPPVAVRARELISRQATHLTRLVEDLLDLARINEGKFTLRLKPCDLRRALEIAMELVQPTLAAHGQTLELHLPDEPVPGVCDETRIAQAVGNLLHNASKYSEHGRTIRLELLADHAAGHAVIAVRDRGIGMTREQLERAFELFAQGDHALARRSGGLGVGLSLAHRLVSLHGGTLVGESAGIGEGSAFTIRFPLRPATPPSATTLEGH